MKKEKDLDTVSFFQTRLFSPAMIASRVGLMVCLMLVPFYGTGQVVEKVCFSAQGGFYEDCFALEISPLHQQHHIHYTTNGNCPTAQSRLYTEPLWLDEGLCSTSDIYTIQISPDYLVFVPDSIRHCIVIRAAVFDENDSCVSEVATNSYFIRSLGCDTHGLPAVSLCADTLDLFDYERGIFVPGACFNPLNADYTGNYYEKGEAWERPVNFEFYERDNEGVNQQAGLRTHGGSGRRLQQKCVKLYARGQYGKKRFKHRFFETIPHDRFKHLVLKPFSASWYPSGVEDHICNQLASQLNVESLASRPVVVYLNGEYWGLYYLQERLDKRYLEDHYGVDPDSVTILAGWTPVVDCGNPQDFLELYEWMSTADLSDPEAYAYATSKIDIASFIDHYVLELFCENTDWPANNMRFWQLGNGKWRWFFYDGDACLHYMAFTAFDNAVYEGDETWPSSWNSTLFFRKLLASYGFKVQFRNRFRELLESTFLYANTRLVFEETKNTVAPEIPFQSHRFGFPVDVDTWNTSMLATQCFLSDRFLFITPVLDRFLNWGVVEDTQPACRIYPNPTHGELHLVFEADSPEEIVIYDLLGRKVFAQACPHDTREITIHPALTPGVYVLKMGTVTQRIVQY